MKDFLYKLLLLLFFEHYMYDKVNISILRKLKLKNKLYN